MTDIYYNPHRNAFTKISTLIQFGLVMIIGAKLMNETERELHPNSPKGFWWHIKDFFSSQFPTKMSLKNENQSI